MAFNSRPVKDIQKIWNKVPHDTDILITHSPPKEMLDDGFGCEELLSALPVISPKIYCLSHAHGCNNRKNLNKTMFINAAVVNRLEPMEQEYYISENLPL